MKAILERLFSRFDSEENEREIEEELCFHLDLLTQEHLQHNNVPLTEARDAALSRFGNVELIKDQCLEINRRSNPLMPVMKGFLVVMFVAGVLVCIDSRNRSVANLGDLLIAVSILGRLLFYVRGLNPSRSCPQDTTRSPLMLNETALPPFTIYDRRKLTPVERVISDK